MKCYGSTKKGFYMKVKGWMKIGENDVSFFQSETDAQMSSLLIEGYALADNVQEFEFEVDDDGKVINRRS